ncbi:P-loop containing nucleoside triphosphate hydrolase protein [Chiua virens]|nr:P-loop containing nucleoside triphosphate hydrolase protein [Chiua virens]
MASSVDKTHTPTPRSITSTSRTATIITPSSPQPSPEPRVALNGDTTGSSYIVIVMVRVLSSPISGYQASSGNPSGRTAIDRPRVGVSTTGAISTRVWVRDVDPTWTSRGPTRLEYGVCGTGKSTLGRALAGVLDVPFVDGDDLHPAKNVAKMARGEPLDDGDRQPWLATVREMAVAGMQRQREGCREGVVVACSALKKTYRVVLRGAGEAFPATHFVYLKGDEGVLMKRMEARRGHFMKAGMLASQMLALESPESEPGVVTVSVEMSTEAQVQTVVDALGLS